MELKNMTGVEVKDASKGIAIIKFADYESEDHHGDVTRKGAFEDGAKVLVSSYNHTSWGGALPVGKGVLKTDGDAAYAELQFFMNTTAGRETFETVKETGELQQWSYGFDIEEKSVGEWGEEKKTVRFLEKLKVHEVSPVMIGAGKSTQTLAVKNANGFGGELEIPSDNLKMSDQCAVVLTAVKSLADRAEEIVALRKADGKKGLAPETATLLGLVSEHLDRIKALLTDSPSEPSNTDEDSTSLILRSLRNLSD